MRIGWWGCLVRRVLVRGGLCKEVLASGAAATLESFAAGGALDKKLMAGLAGAVGVVIAGFAAEIAFS